MYFTGFPMVSATHSKMAFDRCAGGSVTNTPSSSSTTNCTQSGKPRKLYGSEGCWAVADWPVRVRS
jgi:hypothetical protein